MRVYVKNLNFQKTYQVNNFWIKIENYNEKYREFGGKKSTMYLQLTDPFRNIY